MLLSPDKIAILLNPSAGGGKALQKKGRLEQLLRQFAIPYDLFITQSEGHLRELTRKNAGRCKILAGAGGDSTFHIMVNELIKAGEDVDFGMIGLGSSNDICKEFGLDTLERSCAALKEQRKRRIDLGGLSGESNPVRYFLGQANIGLGVWVNRYIEELAGRWVRPGRTQGLAGVRGVIHSFRTQRAVLSVAVESESGKSEVPLTLAVFSNIRYWATGRLINPTARPDDGWLDGCLIRACSFLRLARLAALCRKGRHVKARGVRFLRSRTFLVSSEQAFPVQADGEILGGSRKPAHFKTLRVTVIPKALNVICGETPADRARLENSP
jgi:diacylglycerol kinase (ATP)